MINQVSQPLVSVIIPVFNASLFITATITSILDQSYKNLELIIINDGSSDNSEEIIRSFNDLRIHYYYQNNAGQCAASNAGISKAKGDYIKFFDADDLMNKEHIQAQLERLQGSTTDIASCAWGRFYDGNPMSAIFHPEPVWKDMETLDWMRNALNQRSDMMAAWLWLIPKNLLDKAGGWDERLSLNNDFEFSTRLLLQAHKIRFAPQAKVYYRSGVAGSLSLRLSEKAYKEAYLSTYLGCSYLLAADNSKQMQRACANRYQEWLFRMYPDYPELIKVFEEQISFLGGSNIKIEGGLFARALAQVIGWKKVKDLKKLFINRIKKL